MRSLDLTFETDLEPDGHLGWYRFLPVSVSRIRRFTEKIPDCHRSTLVELEVGINRRLDAAVSVVSYEHGRFWRSMHQEQKK
jgi:hypothetical protein